MNKNIDGESNEFPRMLKIGSIEEKNCSEPTANLQRIYKKYDIKATERNDYYIKHNPENQQESR